MKKGLIPMVLLCVMQQASHAQQIVYNDFFPGLTCGVTYEWPCAGYAGPAYYQGFAANWDPTVSYLLPPGARVTDVNGSPYYPYVESHFEYGTTANSAGVSKVFWLRKKADYGSMAAKDVLDAGLAVWGSSAASDQSARMTYDIDNYRNYMIGTSSYSTSVPFVVNYDLNIWPGAVTWIKAYLGPGSIAGRGVDVAYDNSSAGGGGFIYALTQESNGSTTYFNVYKIDIASAGVVASYSSLANGIKEVVPTRIKIDPTNDRLYVVGYKKTSSGTYGFVTALKFSAMGFAAVQYKADRMYVDVERLSTDVEVLGNSTTATHILWDSYNPASLTPTASFTGVSSYKDIATNWVTTPANDHIVLGNSLTAGSYFLAYILSTGIDMDYGPNAYFLSASIYPNMTFNAIHKDNDGHVIIGGVDNSNVITSNEYLYTAKFDVIGLSTWGNPIPKLTPAAVANSTLQISLAPVPATDNITLSVVNRTKGNTYSYHIINMLGQDIVSASVYNDNTILNIGNYASGVYSLQLMENNNIISTKRFVKE